MKSGDSSSSNPDIRTSQEFCEALRALLKDDGWPSENPSTRHFVDSMQAWLSTMEGRNRYFDAPNDDFVTWSDLYKLIYLAGEYE